MATTSTVGELYTAKIVTEEILSATIDAYLADPSAPAVLGIGERRLDVALVVLADPEAWMTVVHPSTSDEQRRAAVRLVVLLATPS